MIHKPYRLLVKEEHVEVSQAGVMKNFREQFGESFLTSEAAGLFLWNLLNKYRDSVKQLNTITITALTFWLALSRCGGILGLADRLLNLSCCYMISWLEQSLALGRKQFTSIFSPPHRVEEVFFKNFIY